MTFTVEQLTEFLDDFQEWYESIWLSDQHQLAGDDCSAAEYFIRQKMLDPLWPDRPPQLP